MTVEMFCKNVKATVKKFIAQNKAYSFMNPINSTPGYWKSFLNGVLAIVKQLSIPTFFMALFYPDIRWNELMIISKLNSLHNLMEDIDKMSDQEKYRELNKNVVKIYYCGHNNIFKKPNTMINIG